MKCPKCQYINPEESFFCLECGSTLEVICIKCENTLISSALDLAKIAVARTSMIMYKIGKSGATIIFATLYIGCFVISMFASQSLDLNKTNEILNKATLESDNYKRNVSNYENIREQAVIEYEVERFLIDIFCRGRCSHYGRD